MKLPGRLLIAAVLILLPVGTRAQKAEDHTQFLRDIVVEPGQTAGDVLCYFCMIRVQGTLTEDAIAIGGSIEVTGTVEGDAIASGGGIRLGPGARIKGDVVAAGGRVERGGQSSVGGDVSVTQWFQLPGQRQLFLLGALGNLGISFGAIALFYALARRRRIEAMAGSLRKHHVLAFLVGAVLIIVITILFDLIDRLRRFSSPLDTLLSLVLLVIFGMGACGLSYELGRHLARGRHPLVAALLGALVVNLVNLIPFLGFLVFCVFSLLALGVVLLSGFGKSAEWLAKLFTRRQAARPPTATA